MLRKTYASYIQNHTDWHSKFEITVICLTTKGAVGELLEAQGIRVIAMNWQGALPSWRLTLKLKRLLKELQADVVHTCLFQAHRHGILAARLAGCRTVIIEEHGDNCWMGWRERLVSRVMAFFATKILAVSQAHAAHLITYMPYQPDKLAVLPNCIDVERLLSVRAKEKNGSAISFVAVGGLREIKNIPLLLKAFALLVEQRPESTLSIVGEGDLKAFLVSLAEELGLGDKVFFLGAREDVHVILAKADIYVHAGHAESFCIAMAEAMCSGCACVAPDCAVFRELTDGGRVALLVTPDDAKAMAEALLSLATNTHDRLRLGMAASEYATGKYHPIQYIMGLMKIYRELGVCIEHD